MAASKTPRASRAAPRYPLRDAPLAFWKVLFPEITATAEQSIAGWVAAGMQRSKADDKLDTVPSAATAIPADWSIHVDNKGVTLSFPDLKTKPKFHRPLLLTPGLLQQASFKDGHPLQQLRESPGSKSAQENAGHLFAAVMSEIDRNIVAALKDAIIRGALVVTGIPSGNPLATRSTVRLGGTRRAFTLDLENNRIRFEPGTPDLVDVEVSRVAAEPGKAKSFEQADALIVEKLKAMLDKHPERGLIAATRSLASELPGDGTIASKADRLRRRFNRTFPDWKHTRS